MDTLDPYVALRCVFFFLLTPSDKYVLLTMLGRLHAVPSERSVHNGRFGVEFPVHPWRIGFHSFGPDAQSLDAQVEQDLAHQRWFHLHHRIVLHLLDIHAYEVTVSLRQFCVIFIN